MTWTQLRLFPAPQPLTERLGPDFFRAIPRAPGIYRMFDEDERLIYVGKARDLRARLNSYRRTHSQSRKTIRLIHCARRIDWELCASETAARLRENELIRTLRPRFNRQGTWPRSARFIQITQTPCGLALTLLEEPDGESYGAFRAGPGEALAALARLLWLATGKAAHVQQLPRELLVLDRLDHMAAEGPGVAEWLADLRAFLAGEHDGAISRLLAGIPSISSNADALFVALQFERLLDFYRRGPMVNRRLQALFFLQRTLITPEELDDLRVRAGDALWDAAPRLLGDGGTGDFPWASEVSCKPS